MSKYEIPFLTACIQAFGKRFDMTRQAAYRYLREHRGLEFLIEFYDVEHLQSMDETIDDAIRMAQKKARLFGGVPTLITYELDPVALQSDLRVKVFPEKACVEWLLFVDANRDKDTINSIHDYDIVIGPIADDGVVLQLTNYREGIYSPEQAALQLQDKYLDQQYYFGTERALQYLNKKKVETV